MFKGFGALAGLLLVIGCSNGESGGDEPIVLHQCQAGDPCDNTGANTGKAGMVKIPPGSFFMGSPEGEGKPREQPMHAVTFAQPFWIDKHEVTTAEFAEFLKENGNKCPHNGTDYDCYDCDVGAAEDVKIDCAANYVVKSTCEAEANGKADQSCDDHPATLVWWPGASAYCAWKGKRLLSEAEWERAANGPGGPEAQTWQRFPWGNACPSEWENGDLPGCGGAPWDATTAVCNCDDAFCHDGFIGTAPVGSFSSGASVEGVLDLSGNAMEWVEDCFHQGFEGAPTDGSAWLAGCEDENRKVATGGSFLDDGANLRCAFRGGDSLGEEEADPDVGFRCGFSY